MKRKSEEQLVEPGEGQQNIEHCEKFFPDKSDFLEKSDFFGVQKKNGTLYLA